MRTPGTFIAKADTVYTSDGHLICANVFSRHLPDYEQRCRERESNARLFAAAPDLYEAVRAMLAGQPLKEVAKLAEAALKKAEGQ